MLKKYETLYNQAQMIDTKESYILRDRLYEGMTFGEIVNILDEIKEITSLMATNLHEFNLDTNEVNVIANQIKSLEKIGDCLLTISKLKLIRGQR